ncbi:PucR family transcriptional regulator [Pseudonocardia acaciae]|uniref:PucR family transcriptional regulator n=1 Tax=Pseudonocardia acaciae TaxID=551276 RepID=UPI00049192D2|nr:helix-turn-helix domain-containing protein [Pseudonocardia acaciae]
MTGVGPTAGARAVPRLPAFADHGGPKVDARDEAALLRRVVAICGHLSALASQEVDLESVARFLSERVGAGVVLLDRGLEVLACAGASDPGDILGVVREHSGASGLHTVLAAAARNRRALTVPVLTGDAASVIVAPVSVGTDVAGYLLAGGARGGGLTEDPADELTEDMRLLVTEHAAMVCGVVIGRDLVVAAAAGRARQELFEALLQHRDRDDTEVDRWARHLGFDADRPYQVLAVAFVEERDQNRRGAGLATLESVLTQRASGAIVAARADEVVAIAPVPVRVGTGSTQAATQAATQAQARALAQACVDTAATRRLGAAAVGIGNPCHTAADIARSYAEARRALAATRRMGAGGGVTAFADLGIHRLLLRVPDVADVRAFAEEVLGALLAEERTSGMEYLATLSVYFNENSSPRRTAQRLHVHPNTVNYRIRRIEEITGLSFDVHRDRLMAEVAAEILAGPGGGPR